MPELEIRTDRLLLVEGRDEVNLFKAMIRDCFEDRDTIQIIDTGGKDRFSERNPCYWQRVARSFFRLLALFEMRTTMLAAVSTAFVTASVALAVYRRRHMASSRTRCPRSAYSSYGWRQHGGDRDHVSAFSTG